MTTSIQKFFQKFSVLFMYFGTILIVLALVGRLFLQAEMSTATILSVAASGLTCVTLSISSWILSTVIQIRTKRYFESSLPSAYETLLFTRLSVVMIFSFGSFVASFIGEAKELNLLIYYSLILSGIVIIFIIVSQRFIRENIKQIRKNMNGM